MDNNNQRGTITDPTGIPFKEDYIQKTLEELLKLTPCREVEFEHGKIVKEYIISENEIKDFLTHALTEQASLFRKGLGEEAAVFEIKYDIRKTKDDYEMEAYEQTLRIGYNQCRTQALEKWEELGL